jgi:hypothetical protein
LEYYGGEWKIFRYNDTEEFGNSSVQDEGDNSDLSNIQIFDSLLQEFNLMKQ